MSNSNKNGPKAFTRTYKTFHNNEDGTQENNNLHTYNSQFKPKPKNPNLVVRNVYFIKNNDEAVIPTKASLGSLGHDLYSVEDVIINGHKTVAISTGLKIIVPKGYEMQIRSRSGLALNHSIFVCNSPATIDWDYEGEIKVILHNLSDESFEIKKGDRIAQAVFSPIIIARFRPNINEKQESSERGSRGFGSSGSKGPSNYLNNKDQENNQNIDEEFDDYNDEENNEE
jgi:dUTP pyrophosphatase